MTLDKDRGLFSDAIRATSEAFGILPVYVEKDYWITRILQQLSRSKFAHRVVWKGGTSLSKGFGLINRFSSDIDIAILAEGMNGNQTKTLISKISKDMAEGLPERDMEGETSKGSRYRKTYHYYDSTLSVRAQGMSLLGNFVIIEINSFANPYPYVRCRISSFIAQFLEQRGLNDWVERYDLHPFEINVLDMRRTLCEKTVSLLRHSFMQPPTDGLRKKIRHFYDLHFLLNADECRDYLHEDFLADFTELVAHDQATFNDPAGWNTQELLSSPLITSFGDLWPLLRGTYESELSQLAYKPIPSSDAIKKTFEDYLKFLRRTLGKPHQ